MMMTITDIASRLDVIIEFMRIKNNKNAYILAKQLMHDLQIDFKEWGYKETEKNKLKNAEHMPVYLNELLKQLQENILPIAQTIQKSFNMYILKIEILDENNKQLTHDSNFVVPSSIQITFSTIQ